MTISLEGKFPIDLCSYLQIFCTPRVSDMLLGRSTIQVDGDSQGCSNHDDKKSQEIQIKVSPRDCDPPPTNIPSHVSNFY